MSIFKSTRSLKQLVKWHISSLVKRSSKTTSSSPLFNKLHGIIKTSYTMRFPFPSVHIFDISNNGFVGRLLGIYFETFNAIKDVEKGRRPEYVNISGLYYSIIVHVKGFQLSSVALVFVLVKVLDLRITDFEGRFQTSLAILTHYKCSAYPTTTSTVKS